MNEGRFQGKPILPPSVLKTTLEPAIPLPNTLVESKGYWEILNEAFGMGRATASYRGHLLTFHGGALPGFYSQVSFMPKEKLGVITFVIGDHCASLRDIVSYNVYDRLLGQDQIPWSDRWLEVRLKEKEAGKDARSKAGSERIADTKPSHRLQEYIGQYEHPAYGVVKIGWQDEQLQFDFHKIRMPLKHFHYDRFETADDERDGKWTVNFMTNPQGDVDKVVMSLDEAEATFTRTPETVPVELSQRLAGTYQTPSGLKFLVISHRDGALYLAFPGQPQERLVPYKGVQFRIEKFSDVTYQFVVEGDQVKALKQRDPAGEHLFARQ